MEPVAIFTSRADLPVIAARVSAPTYRDAAVLIQYLVADRTGCSKSLPLRTASPWKRLRSWACSTEQN